MQIYLLIVVLGMGGILCCTLSLLLSLPVWVKVVGLVDGILAFAVAAWVKLKYCRWLG